MKTAMLIVCGVLVSTTVSAQVGFGGTDCGKWIAEKNFAQRTWLLGYLSGINFMVAKGKYDPLNKIDSAEQIFQWMDNYCRANPLKSVRDGGADLYLELQKK